MPKAKKITLTKKGGLKKSINEKANFDDNISKASKSFNDSLKQQDKIINLIPKNYTLLNNMKIIVALNIGIIIGLFIGKYFL